MTRAQALLRSRFFCDGHADTLQYAAFRGDDFVGGNDRAQVDLPRMREAGVDLQFMALFVEGCRGSEATVRALRMALEGHRAEERSDVGLVLDRHGLERARRGAGPHLLLSLEGADPLDSSLDLLEIFFRWGVRAIGLSHNRDSCAAGGCEGRGRGLTGFGRALVPAMEELGMLVDVAHVSRRAFDDVLERAARPVVNSHCCCRAFVDLERNMADSQLQAIASTGGLAAVTYVPDFLRDDGEPATTEDVLRHLERMVEVMGIEHVGLGSDFDGVDELPEDLGGPTEVVHLVERMLQTGWNEEDVTRVIGGNWHRVLAAVLPG